MGKAGKVMGNRRQSHIQSSFRSSAARWMRGSSSPVLLMLLAIALCAFACSDSAAPSGQAAVQPEESSWAIHVYIDHEGASRRVDFPPVNVSSTDTAVEDRSGIRPASLKPSAAVQVNGSSTTAQDWALVWAAGTECGLGVPAAAGRKNNEHALLPPWSFVGDPVTAWQWLIFPHQPRSCDEALEYEETLVCMADKLSQVADTSVPLTWRGPANARSTLTAYQGIYEGGAMESFRGVWTIPPQADKDRFIARDLAITLLAHVPVIDNMPLQDWRDIDHGQTCSEMYASTGESGLITADRSLLLFGLDVVAEHQPLYAADEEIYSSSIGFPQNITVGTPHQGVKDLALSRLALEGHMLRASGRLLHDLVRESVYADLSGAEQRGAHAQDSSRANDVAWGRYGEYNSLAHAIRIVAGRWEMIPGGPGVYGRGVDPSCGGVPALNLLRDALGSDESARRLDKQITTTAQAEAVAYVERSGVVVPGTALQSSATSPAVLKDLVIGALAKQAAVAVNMPLAQYQATAPYGQLTAAIGAIRDGDMHFALQRNMRTWRALTNKADDLSGSQPATKDVAVEALSGIPGAFALTKGISRTMLANNSLASFSGVLEASQCDETFAFNWESTQASTTQDPAAGNYDIWTALGADAADWPQPAGEPHFSHFEFGNYSNSILQNVFTVAQAIQRRLVMIANRVRPASRGSALKPEEISRDAAAELEAWAGPGRIVTFIEGGISGPSRTVDNVYIELQGFEPKDFGVQTVEQIADEISVVFGPPWMAECAVKTGVACPPDFASVYTRKAVSSSVSSGEAVGKTFGVSTRVRLKFNLSTLPGIADVWSNATDDNHLFVVAAHDPSVTTARGRVLGPLALRDDSDPGYASPSTSQPVSRMQSELLDAIFSGWKGSFAESSSYCVDGVPRDVTAPLENELTSDSDGYENSWKHYVTLAKQAADRADRLGQQMVEYGLQQEIRREAAGEELANICGEDASLDDVETDPITGETKAGKGNAVLEFCLTPPKHDLVFLTKDPRPSGNAVQSQAVVLEALGCGATDPNIPKSTLCAKYQADAQLALNQDAIAALNLSDPAPPAAKIDECVTYADAAKTLTSAFGAETFNREIGAERSWTADSEVSNIAQQLKLNVAVTDGEWTLETSGFKIMDSHAPAAGASPAWPGCLRAGSNCDWPNNKAAAVFNDVFRWCTGDPHDALGSCGNGDMRGELNTLLWRVKGSLWLLGAMSGQIPRGMFRMPLPATDWTTWVAVPHVSPVPMVYGLGTFGPDGAPLGRSTSEAQAIGIGQDIHANFTVHGPPAAHELPAWIRGAYEPATRTRYRHLDALNVDGSMDFTGVSLFLQKKMLGAGVSGDKIDSAARRRIAEYTKGMQCAVPYGDPVRPPEKWSASDVLTVFSGIKTALRSGSAIRKRYDVGENGDGLWATRFCWGGGDRLGDCGPFDNRYAGERPIADWWQAPMYRAYINNPGPFGRIVVPVESWDESTWTADGYHDGIIVAGGDGAATATPRDERVFAFANSGAPHGACGAMAQFNQALALACVGSVNGGVALSAPPSQITTEQDLAQLEQFLLNVAADGRKALSRVALENIPKRVVQDIRAGTVTPGGVTGKVGQNLLELENAIRGIPDAWNRFTTDIERIANAIRLARNAIAAARIANKGALIPLDAMRFQAWSNIATGTSKIVGGGLSAFTGGGLGSLVSGTTEGAALIAQGAQQLAAAAKTESVAADQLQNSVDRATVDLVGATIPLNEDLRKAIEDVRTAATNVKIKSAELDGMSSSAKSLAAKGTGQDFAITKSGKVQLFPVNTVLSRLYGSTEMRYKRALRDAKAMAYLARRAIEQRLGVPLESIQTPVGALDPPSSWADDVCRLNGIDYKNVRYAPGPDAGSNAARADINRQLLTEFSDSFVGDYVDKLANFVEYYNMEYPSHDADDIAILSLKDDLLEPQSSCFVDAPNLLLYSGRLDAVGPATSVQKGWRLSDCPTGSEKCLSLHSEDFLVTTFSDEIGPPSEAARGEVTWLHDTAPPAAGTKGIPLPSVPGPTGFVWQDVALERGQYILTWWDQGRAADGTETQSPVPYRVAVFDNAFTPITGYMGLPNNTFAAAFWSPRRQLRFSVSEPGHFKVGFAASDAGPTMGSVAIANVQLEAVSPQGDATTYIATDSTRRVPSNQCRTSTSEAMRAAFARRCDAGGCFYDLKTPILIDTQSIVDPASTLNGKLAKGNFNFRNVSLALNLVGTGVRDCTGSTSSACYGSDYVQYSLDHDASRVGIIDWSGDEWVFDFGSATVEHAKAMAAERFMTIPLGQVDVGLLAQTGIEKPELRGRPLDGNYRLRIHDSAALRWDRVEDIQFVLKYRYWSRIQKKAPPSR
jgi:hypothetical protein